MIRVWFWSISVKVFSNLHPCLPSQETVAAPCIVVLNTQWWLCHKSDFLIHYGLALNFYQCNAICVSLTSLASSLVSFCCPQCHHQHPPLSDSSSSGRILTFLHSLSFQTILQSVCQILQKLQWGPFFLSFLY